MQTDRSARNAELMRLAEAATQRPLRAVHLENEEWAQIVNPRSFEIADKLTDEDAAYIVAACNAVPDLVRENEEMAKALSDARSFIRNAHSQDVRSQASLLADIERLVPLEEEP